MKQLITIAGLIAVLSTTKDLQGMHMLARAGGLPRLASAPVFTSGRPPLPLSSATRTFGSFQLPPVSTATEDFDAQERALLEKIANLREARDDCNERLDQLSRNPSLYRFARLALQENIEQYRRTCAFIRRFEAELEALRKEHGRN